MFRFMFATLAMLTVMPGLAPAQEPRNDDSYVVEKYYVDLIGYAGKVEQTYGPFGTPQEADDFEADWEKNHKDDFRIPRRRTERVRTIPQRPSTTRPRQADPLPSVPRPGIAPKPRPVQLIGQSWVGSETLGGYGRLEFRFMPNNKVQMVDAQETVYGTYYQSGNSVSLIFFDGNCTYSGTISANGIKGNALAGSQQFTWNVSR
jgi:hypothetical protein